MPLDDLSSLVTIVGFVAGIVFYLWRRTSNRLTADEKQLLTAGKDNGLILIMKVDAFGDWVRADKTDFMKTDDRAYASRFLEALQKLVTRGLVAPEGRAYRLTGSGFAKARSL